MLGSYLVNLFQGFWFLIAGFTKVFSVLAIIIVATHFLVHKLIPWANEKWPEKVKSKKKSKQNEVDSETVAIITAAISQATAGKGIPKYIQKN